MTDTTRRLLDGVVQSDRRALAQAITLIESGRESDVTLSKELLESLPPNSGTSIRIGITGVPGVGKSTFIARVGTLLTGRGHRVAVLAIDPSSTVSGGSILGDKTRMENLAQDPAAYIRPSPRATKSGGVARHTREAMLLCEAAGFDVILVETVGVGQSETAVADMVDTFVLFLLPGGGDELQGIKRGVMELADVVVIHKADGASQEPAQVAARQFESALQLLPRRNPQWARRVLTCSAVTGDGVEAVHESVLAHRAALGAEGLAQGRIRQSLSWFEDTLRDMLVESFLRRPEIAAALPRLRDRVRDGKIQPTAAALELLGL
jgi:LAO/AO transport system kinase